MIRRAALTGALLMLLSASSVSAATRQVEMFDFGFSPTRVRVSLGDSVRWHNGSPSDHTATANQFSLWSVLISVGATSPGVPFQRAGTFAYWCVIHPEMKGKVAVRMRATPTSGRPSTPFAIRVALANAPSGFRHDIQMRRAGGRFATWRSTTLQTASFRAPGPGTFEFRARLRRTSDGVATGWSPVLSVRVTQP